MALNVTNMNKLSKWFLITLAIILSVGAIMVYSASYIYAKENFGSSTYFFSGQLTFIIVGIIFAMLVGSSKFSFWVKYGVYIHLFWIIVLALTLIPGLAVEVKGAHRWINVLGLSLQPGEIIKYTLVLSSMLYFENFSKFTSMEKIQYAIPLAAPLLILIRQPDFGTFFVCFLVISFVCYLSSFPRKYFYGIFTSGIIIGTGLLFLKAYRIERLLTYLDPWKHPKTSGFQIIQSFLAFANGGFFGQGLGNSNEKLFYLPEAHNDFIFSVIGEELGFVGVTLMIGLFITFIYLGLKIAVRMKNRWAFIAASTVIFIIGLQSLLNMGVVLGLLPTKGLNLPFISYGGSSLVSNFFGVGLILSAVKENLRKEGESFFLFGKSNSES
ncbi:MAG: putative lipid II flippase FtsW [Epsilonproteobacteria bacterium]|nr:MAG: putative lipid II flippase FtsW [Campylobacterota bacterium]RLA66834.1 MAG: putative lipid II flippase FtsW [Campylobacterota bacterium]